jgi:hypothetical protein
MTWLLVGLTWLLLAFAVAVVIGRGIRIADQRLAPAAWTAEVDAFLRQESANVAGHPATGPQLPRP